MLPSVASLKALRAFARKDQGTKPMIGFGDPLFNPSQTPAVTTRRDQVGGAGADDARLYRFLAGRRRRSRAGLRSLAATARHRRRTQRGRARISASPPATFISAAMPAKPRSSVRRSPTTASSILPPTASSPATSRASAEPSLALSIPEQPTELDDGLLTASEVAQLKLNADWVVLSACNTIAGDKPGAEALSGLARVVLLCRCAGATGLALGGRFGSRDPADHLDLRSLKADPRLGRAEALRQAMLAYLNDTSSPRNAYPAFWGPFALIGEGARAVVATLKVPA